MLTFIGDDRRRRPRFSEAFSSGRCPVCQSDLYPIQTARGPAWRCRCNEPTPPAAAAEVPVVEVATPIAETPAEVPVIITGHVTHSGHCRHCGGRSPNRPRGLCWDCYYTPGVREQYPSTSKFAHRGSGLHNGAGRLPRQPTSALPLTDAKVAVMQERVRNREALFHPDDAQPTDRRAIPVPDLMRYGRHCPRKGAA